MICKNMQLLNRFSIGQSINALAFGYLSMVTVFAAPPMMGMIDADYEAAGVVVPAGTPALASQGTVNPAIYQAPVKAPGQTDPNDVVHVGYCDASECDAPYCDTPGCDDACSDACGDGCGCGCGCQSGGCFGGSALAAPLWPSYSTSPSSCGCNHCQADNGVLGNLRNLCLFCRGQGCGLCQSFGRLNLRGLGACLRPYGEAGLCAQRWYDLSVEALILNRRSSHGDTVISRRGGPAAPITLTASSAEDDDLTLGARLSASFIFGVGGNVEVSYLGGNEWSGSATATGTGDLNSFISDFATNPGPTGFDDPDGSLSHTLTSESIWHSGEVNYRRRTVGPYCRFQWSWLAGLRYIRFDDSLNFVAVGLRNNGAGPLTPRFLDMDTTTQNDLFGAQIGGDLWWNVRPGINLGVEMKAGLLQNNADRVIVATGNSLGPGATPGTRTGTAGTSKSTAMAELALTGIYRISHSWSLRGSYYVVGIDDVLGVVDEEIGNTLFGTPQTALQSNFEFGSLTMQGFTLGVEYLW